MVGLTPCEHCVRRPREFGGNASCPVFEHRKIAEANGLLVKESMVTAWPRHLTLWPTGCSGFKAGDRRLRPPKVEQEGLF